MTAISAYLNGLKWSIQNIKIWIWLYLCNFLLAALAAIPLMSLLEEKLGYSFAAQQLMEGFDYTVYTDFMREYGAAVLPILSQSTLLIIFYVFLSVFLMGGILETCKNVPQKAHFQSFAVGSIKYFWKLFFITLCFLVIHGLVFFLFFNLFMSLIHGGDLKQLDSELVIYWRGGIVLGIYLFFAGIILTIHDFAKIYLVEHNPKWIFTAIKNGIQLVFKNFRATFCLSILNWLIFGLLSFIYLQLRGDDLNSTVGGLWFIFILGQVFILIKMGLKILNLASKTGLYKQISSEKMT
jgi:hypothetical protein